MPHLPAVRGGQMTTIETELKKYRMCRAEMERGCNIECVGCPHNIPGSLMRRFTSLDATINGESPS